GSNPATRSYRRRRQTAARRDGEACRWGTGRSRGGAFWSLSGCGQFVRPARSATRHWPADDIPGDRRGHHEVIVGALGRFGAASVVDRERPHLGEQVAVVGRERLLAERLLEG